MALVRIILVGRNGAGVGRGWHLGQQNSWSEGTEGSVVKLRRATLNLARASLGQVNLGTLSPSCPISSLLR